jgi:hypothetical protein
MRAVSLVCLLFASACTGGPDASVDASEKISRPNEYVGWSEKLYDGRQRSSFLA